MTLRLWPTSRMTKRILAWTVLTLIAIVGMMPAAHADTSTFNDSTTDETSAADIRWVKVQNGWRADGSLAPQPQDRHTSQQDSTPWVGPPKTAVFIDTKPRNAGPEYRMVVQQDDGLYGVNGWQDHGTFIQQTACGRGGHGYSANYPLSSDRVVASIKPACIGGAGKVRISVHTGMFNRSKQDWAKARNTFYPSVLR